MCTETVQTVLKPTLYLVFKYLKCINMLVFKSSYLVSGVILALPSVHASPFGFMLVSPAHVRIDCPCRKMKGLFPLKLSVCRKCNRLYNVFMVLIAYDKITYNDYYFLGS